jgi:hypothetical protein
MGEGVIAPPVLLVSIVCPVKSASYTAMDANPLRHEQKTNNKTDKSY